MPLIKSPSKEAVGENISTEIKHGKKRSQAVAIALETQRRAGGGKKKPKTTDFAGKHHNINMA